MSDEDNQPLSRLDQDKSGNVVRDGGAAELARLARFADVQVEQRLDASLREYWLMRAAMHTHDNYLGLTLSKFPEDLRVYEHLLWAQRPEIVIEIGTQFGASALWFRDRLRILAGYGLIKEPRVITIDLESGHAQCQLDGVDPNWRNDISVITGDVRDPQLPQRIQGMIPASANCLVVEDSAHTYDTTLAALEGFSRFVPEGGFMVIEDGYVDIEPMRLRGSWPRGVLQALADWLGRSAGHAFHVRRDLELYGITCHPGGLLQRQRA